MEGSRTDNQEKKPKSQAGQTQQTTLRERGSFQVMAGLIGLVKPLMGIMLIAILMGCVGNLMATFLTILGSYGLVSIVAPVQDIAKIPFHGNLAWILGTMICFAALRGILRYAEQACNHFIAFKLLARIRHQVFAALRRLAPAKLDGRGKGNLIAMITSDIELLEVFYAHTISPVAIAVITSAFMLLWFSFLHPAVAVFALCFYLLAGVVVPMINSRMGEAQGRDYRKAFGRLNTTVLDNLYGLEEILQFHQEEKRLQHMAQSTDRLEETNRGLKDKESKQRIVTDSVILAAGIFMAVLCSILAASGQLEGWQAIVVVTAMMSSFGPVAALASLSNNLNHTLASGNRVLSLLEEEPVTRDLLTGKEEVSKDIVCDKVSFSYRNLENSLTNVEELEKEGILHQFSAVFSEKQIHGILGKSGCGKSTLLKLLMRFYETEDGSICYGEHNVDHIKTKALRSHIAYVTQETFLFQDTIANNIRLARPEASLEEVQEAAKKASVHDFIQSLPKQYDTRLSELGNSVSGGEKQRIGIARAFLSGSPILLLDEPTSNIDSLNEGMVLKSLQQEKAGKTVILVSHRRSTLGIADQILEM